MGTHMQPRANLRPMSRQPFRPGQWSGAKMSRNTTYIQNNFYGSVFAANRNYGYAQPCHCHHDKGCDMPKWLQWVAGIGVGSTILGGILNLFGKKTESNGVSEGGGVGENSGMEPSDTSEEDQMNALNNTSSNGVSEGSGVGGNSGIESSDTSEGNQMETQNNTAVQSNDQTDNSWSSMTDGITMTCSDDSGKTLDISGKLNIIEAGDSDDSAPTEFTITDSSSGTDHVYTFRKTDETTTEGNPIYKCESMNGQTTTSNNAYTLVLEEGSPKLVQYQGQENFGSGLSFNA